MDSVTDARTDAHVVPENPLGLDGPEFIEFASPNPAGLEQTILKFGFLKIGQHKRRNVTLFRQNQINFVVNNEPGTFAAKFAKQHGPCVCAVGFRVRSAQRAFDLAVQRGARPIAGKASALGHSVPAVYGVGDSAIYFVDRYRAPVHFDDDFRYLQPELSPKGRGLLGLDHLTFGVAKGDLDRWAEFFGKVFGFRQVRGFDIQSERTGLRTQILRSPCRKFSVRINEPTNEKSQAQEFLDEHRGAGVRAIALSSNDIVASVRGLTESGVNFLEARGAASPGIFGSDRKAVLQASALTVVGPTVFEVVQRLDPDESGESTVRAIFQAVERDQVRRGYV